VFELIEFRHVWKCNHCGDYFTGSILSHKCENIMKLRKGLFSHKNLPSDKWYINPEKFKGGECMAKSVKKSFELKAKIIDDEDGGLLIKKGNSTTYSIILSQRVIINAKKLFKTNDLKGRKVRIIIE
jgi:hypothetical protein